MNTLWLKKRLIYRNALEELYMLQTRDKILKIPSCHFTICDYSIKKNVSEYAIS